MCNTIGCVSLPEPNWQAGDIYSVHRDQLVDGKTERVGLVTGIPKRAGSPSKGKGCAECIGIGSQIRWIRCPDSCSAIPGSNDSIEWLSWSKHQFPLCFSYDLCIGIRSLQYEVAHRAESPGILSRLVHKNYEDTQVRATRLKSVFLYLSLIALVYN